jgi:hypothetical protein
MRAGPRIVRVCPGPVISTPPGSSHRHPPQLPWQWSQLGFLLTIGHLDVDGGL